MIFAIDTNRLSDVASGEPRASELFRRADRVYLPFIVLAELRAGFLKGTRAAENERRLAGLRTSGRVEILFADEQTTHEYARLHNTMRQQGTPLPYSDVWIAALCIQHRLPLLTRDYHFDRIPNLQRVV